MAILHVSESDFQTISRLATIHQLTPDAYIKGVIAGTIDVESDIETLEVLNDADAMTAIQADRESQARGELPQGTSIETLLRQVGLED